jgi:hypothetical protein
MKDERMDTRDLREGERDRERERERERGRESVLEDRFLWQP